jgi:hypothetical protein
MAAHFLVPRPAWVDNSKYKKHMGFIVPLTPGARLVTLSINRGEEEVGKARLVVMVLTSPAVSMGTASENEMQNGNWNYLPRTEPTQTRSDRKSRG